MSGGHFYLATQTESARLTMQLNLKGLAYRGIEECQGLGGGYAQSVFLTRLARSVHTACLPVSTDKATLRVIWPKQTIYSDVRFQKAGATSFISCIKLPAVRLAANHSILERKPVFRSERGKRTL